MNIRFIVSLALAAILVPGLVSGDRVFARGDFFGAVYTMSTAAAGNALLTFFRLPDGRLSRLARRRLVDADPGPDLAIRAGWC